MTLCERFPRLFPWRLFCFAFGEIISCLEYFLGGNYELLAKEINATEAIFIGSAIGDTHCGAEPGGGQSRADAANAVANSSSTAGECLDLGRSFADRLGESS